MKLLTIYPIQSCNLNCVHCPSKKFVYPVGSENNKINNEMIFKWIDKYLDPQEWMIEITGGGEPGMYPEIEPLIKGLEQRGFYGEVKTNGTLPLPQSPNFKRIAAWHTDIEHPPSYFDEMIIINNPNDVWQEKEKYCKEHSIPYQIYQFIPFQIPRSMRKPDQYEPLVKNEFITDWCVVYSGGRISRCFAASSSDSYTIQRMDPPRLKSISQGCPYCTNVHQFERWIPQEWIKKEK